MSQLELLAWLRDCVETTNISDLIGKRIILENNRGLLIFQNNCNNGIFGGIM